MVGSMTDSRQLSAEIQAFLTRQFDCLVYYLREMDSPARLIVLLTVTIFCYVALEGALPKSTH